MYIEGVWKFSIISKKALVCVYLALLAPLSFIQVLHCADSKASGVEITITAAVADVRPYIVCCIIRNIDLCKTSTTYKQFIALQVN